jgi:hypothetical protein
LLWSGNASFEARKRPEREGMYFDADGNGSYSSTSIEPSREKREIPKVHATVDEKSQGNRVFRAIIPVLLNNNQPPSQCEVMCVTDRTRAP